MNSQIPNAANLNANEIQGLVRNDLEVFVRKCLESNFDIIIPVEGEGLAILLPYLANYPNRVPDIVPSNSVRFIEDKVFKGKKVLIIDVSVSTGRTLLRTANDIKEKSGDEPALAALLVQRDFEHPKKLLFQDYLSLSPNAYAWARNVIVVFLMRHVFVHPTDPPLWEVEFHESQRNAIIKSLLRFSGSYALEPASDRDSWIRISIDKIALKHSNWLRKNITNEPNNKIRILISRDRNIVWILPLFFPVIPSEERIPLSLQIEGAKERMPKQYEKVLENARNVESRNPYVAYNWVSSVGSLLMLDDFFAQLRIILPEFRIESFKMTAPIPSIYQYSCSVEVLRDFENVAKEMLNVDAKHGQMGFHDNTFTFSSFEPSQISKEFEINSPYNHLTPEQILLYTLGKWAIDKKEEEQNESLDSGLSIEQIEIIAQSMSRWSISYAIDRLVDEGVLKPRVGEISSGYISRKYVFAGETVRKRLKSFGLAISMSSANQSN